MTRRARAIVLIVVAALLIGGGEAVAAPPRAPATAKPIDPRDVGLLPSAAPAPVAPQTPSKADFAAQSRLDGGAGTHFDPQRSTLVSRTMFTTEYVNADGTHSVRQSNQPMNVQDEHGQWQPVQTTLEMDPATKRADADNHPLSPSLATKANDAAVLQVESGGHTAGLTLDQAAPTTAAVKGDSVTYPEVAAGTDLDYEVTPGAVKETIKLKRPPADGRSSWKFKLTTGDLAPKLEKNGVRHVGRQGRRGEDRAPADRDVGLRGPRRDRPGDDRRHLHTGEGRFGLVADRRGRPDLAA
ncbi:hypothetical protein OHS18_12780 [Amycolatopsis sp. NBC_00355]|uniref:hypothetical protein n=1 Tax=Amycolatopsis sp. NBC_00355 TaxID=2975957 RepID=UPI002E27465B